LYGGHNEGDYTKFQYLLLGNRSTLAKARGLERAAPERTPLGPVRGSYLGLAWAFLSPLLMVALLTLIFSEVIGIRFREVTGDSALNFGLYLYCGLLPFLAYSQALT
jgi:hypothetical protein